MVKECITEGHSRDEAIEAAAEEMGVSVADLEYEVLDEGSRKRFGIGTERPVQVRAWIKDDASSKDLASTVEDISEVAPAEYATSGEEGESRLPSWDQEELELTDEQLDLVADTALEVLREILGYFGAKDAAIEEYEGDEGEIILDVVGVDLAVLIGRHGRALESLQSLVSAIVHRRLGFRYPVIVDIEGYRHRRRQKIDTMAKSAADRAVRQHSPVKLRPMSPYERRLVHVALRSDDRVVTGSEGVEPNRLVVIKPRR